MIGERPAEGQIRAKRTERRMARISQFFLRRARRPDIDRGAIARPRKKEKSW